MLPTVLVIREPQSVGVYQRVCVAGVSVFAHREANWWRCGWVTLVALQLWKVLC